MTPFHIVLDIISYCFYLNNDIRKKKCMTRKHVNDWGHSSTLVTKRYGCEVVGREFKSELDLLLLLLCEDNKLSWL